MRDTCTDKVFLCVFVKVSMYRYYRCLACNTVDEKKMSFTVARELERKPYSPVDRVYMMSLFLDHISDLVDAKLLIVSTFSRCPVA